MTAARANVYNEPAATSLHHAEHYGKCEFSRPEPIFETRFMQIVLIVLFAALLSLPNLALEYPLYRPLTAPTPTLAAAGILTLIIPILAGLGSWACLRRLRLPGGFPYAATLFGHIHAGMRLGLLLAFALLVSQTGWLGMVRHGWHLARFPFLDEFALVTPVLLGAVLSWLVLYPADRALRQAAAATLPPEPHARPIWSLLQYLDFQVRNQILTVLVPMGLFIVAADLMAVYGDRLVEWTDLAWIPEAALAVVAALIFLISPLMLRFIWQTQRMEPSPLRSRLEDTCRRLGLKYRDILIWKSHGAMVNAAVMGLLPPVRYILLSDGLLDHLSREQVEAVFGHEAGHVKEHHIAWYMIFAIGSMLAVSLAGEWLNHAADLSRQAVELTTAGTVAFIWIVIFGWISRRFERQADLYGVRCLDGAIPYCSLPCWRHNITPPTAIGEQVCTSAAQIFASALEAVAALNGISKYARSWRHSSIASRQDFIRQVAFYPESLSRFERSVRRIKAALLGITFTLSVLAAWFYWPMLWPRHPQDFQYRREPAVWVQRSSPATSPASPERNAARC